MITGFESMTFDELQEQGEMMAKVISIERKMSPHVPRHIQRQSNIAHLSTGQSAPLQNQVSPRRTNPFPLTVQKSPIEPRLHDSTQPLAPTKTEAGMSDRRILSQARRCFRCRQVGHGSPSCALAQPRINLVAHTMRVGVRTPSSILSQRSGPRRIQTHRMRNRGMPHYSRSKYLRLTSLLSLSSTMDHRSI